MHMCGRLFKSARSIWVAIFLLTALTALLAATTPAVAQTNAAPKRDSGSANKPASDALMHTLFSGHGFEQVAISPDGKGVAFVETTTSGKSGLYVSSTTQASTTQGKPRRMTAGKAAGSRAAEVPSEDSPAWSPDGRSLAFLSDAASAGQAQLYVLNIGSGKVRKLFTENANRAAGPLVAEAAQTGVIKDAVTEQRLAVIDVGDGKLTQISPADMYVYEFNWSPDNQRFVVTAAHGNGDNNWYIAQIYTVSASGGEMKSIYKPTLQIANPAWSPDGKSVAFISGLMSDEPSVGGDIFVVSADGGEARNVTPDMKASA